MVLGENQEVLEYGILQVQLPKSMFIEQAVLQLLVMQQIHLLDYMEYHNE